MMRSFTTLSLGAAALICAGLPLAAQVASPDAPPSATPAAVPAANEAPTATPAPAATVDKPATTAAVSPDAAAPEAKVEEGNPEDTNGIAAMVNDESISEYEVRQRVLLFVATQRIEAKTDEEKKRLRTRALESLQEEKIELQEARKKRITVSPVEIDREVGKMITGASIDQVREVLRNAGSSEEALRAQIMASIAWRKAVAEEYSSSVNITPAQVDAEMARYAEGANKAHYLVSEIFLPVDSPEQDAKVKKDADEVIGQIRGGSPFPEVARQFSRNPSAAAGGDIGWVYDGQLAPDLNAPLGNMTPNQVADPIRGTGGYYILGLRARQEPLGTKIETAPALPTGPNSSLPLARLLLPMGGATKEQIEGAMKAAAQVKASVVSCDQLKKIPEAMQGAVFYDLGEMKLSDLNEDIQKALIDTKGGEIAQPYLSEAGIEIIARCDKRASVLTAFTMPTRDQVEGQLFEEQISAMARRYKRDLKRNSNIQVRDGSKPDPLFR